MQQGKCPHCDKNIQLLSPGDMEEEYSITPNVLQHAKETGNFPAPWISFSNRAVYLKDDIERYSRDRALASAEPTVNKLRVILDKLSDREREEVLQSLTPSDDGGKQSRRRSSATKP